MKTRSQTSQRQQQLLRFITDYSASRGYSPTLREIGEAVGLSSSATVHHHLAKLQRAGLLRRANGVRALQPVSQPSANELGEENAHLRALLAAWLRGEGDADATRQSLSVRQ